jgi:hypothetical protein
MCESYANLSLIRKSYKFDMLNWIGHKFSQHLRHSLPPLLIYALTLTGLESF